MRKMDIVAIVAGSVAILFILIAGLNLQKYKKGGRKILIFYSHSPDKSVYEGAITFKKYVESHSNMEIKVFTGGQLTKSKKKAKKLQQKGQIAIIDSADGIYKSLPLVQSKNVAFLFKDWQHIQRFMSSSFGLKMKQNFIEQTNSKVIGFTYRGSRCILLKKPAQSVKDFRKLMFMSNAGGLKNKSPRVDLIRKVFEGQVLEFDTNEFATGFQSNLIDGLPTELGNIDSQKLYDLGGKYLVPSRHMQRLDIRTMSNKVWAKLNDKQREVILEGMKKADEKTTEIALKDEENIINKFKDKGVTVLDDFNMTEFEQRVEERLYPEIDQRLEEAGFGKNAIEQIKAL